MYLILRVNENIVSKNNGNNFNETDLDRNVKNLKT